MKATRERVVDELQSAGLSEDELVRMGIEYWIDYIVEYRRTGHCGSVNWSTVEFIPVISKLLEATRTVAARSA